MAQYSHLPIYNTSFDLLYELYKRIPKFSKQYKTLPRQGLDSGGSPEDITDLEKKLYQFSEVVEHSYDLLEPHHITTYLTELASEFNSFYGNTQILKEDNKYMAYHLNLVKAFYQTMKNGLWLLGIEIPEKM